MKLYLPGTVDSYILKENLFTATCSQARLLSLLRPGQTRYECTGAVTDGQGKAGKGRAGQGRADPENPPHPNFHKESRGRTLHETSRRAAEGELPLTGGPGASTHGPPGPAPQRTAALRASSNRRQLRGAPAPTLHSPRRSRPPSGRPSSPA